MWSSFQGLSYLGDKFSHSEGKPSISGSRISGSQFQVSSRIFGCYFSGKNGTLLFVMGRGYSPRVKFLNQSAKRILNYLFAQN